MINALINEALASHPAPARRILFVADIAARRPGAGVGDAVLVRDASADPTVESSAALYAWNPATSAWLKVAEYESMDVELNWDRNQRAADLDAGADRHCRFPGAHAREQVDAGQVQRNDGGLVRFGGQPIPAEWNGAAW
ncbi:hypothetical protein ACPA9J_10380 [Pseudomonas aeruginosa]